MLKKNFVLLKILLFFLSLFSFAFCVEKNDFIKPANNSNTTKEKIKYYSFFLNSTVETLDDKNFDEKVSKGIFHNYLILFTVKKCDICNNLITTFENVQKKYENNTKTNLKFGKVDILMSGWTSMRFELDRLPNIIYVSKRRYSVFPANKNFTEEEIINFFEDEDKNYKIFPRQMGYFDVFMKVFHIISSLLHEKYPFWNENYSWGMVGLFILIFCIVEYFIIKYCCRRYKRGDKNKIEHHHAHHQHEHEHHHGSKTSDRNRLKKSKPE